MSSDPKDYERLLVGQKYFDPEDNVYYVTTRIAVTRDKHRHIVAFRVFLLANDNFSVHEDYRPVHVADVVRMIADYRQLSNSQETAISDCHQMSPDDDSDGSSASLVSPRSKQRLISKVKKAMPISIPTPTDTPLVSVEDPNTLVRRHCENLKRSRTKRLPFKRARVR